MLTIDGSTLEGGGQLTRLALCLAAITHIPVRIHSIRAGRVPASTSASARMRTRNSDVIRNRRSDRDQNRDRAKGDGVGGGSSNDSRRQRNRATANTKASTNATAAGGGVGGLKDSHLAALNFLAEHCGAKVSGAEVGSTEVTFRPSFSRTVTDKGSSMVTPHRKGGETRSRMQTEYSIELHKPGSVWLIFQAVFPYLVFGTRWVRRHHHPPVTAVRAKTDSVHNDSTNGVGDEGEDENDETITLTLRGGTNVSKAMSTEYMTQVFLPVAARIGLPRLTIETIARGWAGGNASATVGEIRVTIHSPFSSPSSAFSNSRRTDEYVPQSGQEEQQQQQQLTQGDENENENGQTLVEPDMISATARASIPPSLQPAHGGSNSDNGKFVLDPFTIASRGTITQITMTVLASPASTIATLTTTLTTLLHTTFPDVSIQTHPSASSDSLDPRRTYILLVAHTSGGWRLGSDALGGTGRPKNATDARRKTDDLCAGVVRDLQRELDRGGCVDTHMLDQLVVFQALAAGTSRVVGHGAWDVVDRHDDKKNINRHDTKNSGMDTRQGESGEETTAVDNVNDEDSNNDNNNVDENGDQIPPDRTVSVGDEVGSLHARTVRWVCETMLGAVVVTDTDDDNELGRGRGQDRAREGVRFDQGGVCRGIGWNRIGDDHNYSNSQTKINRDGDSDGDDDENDRLPRLDRLSLA